MNMIAIANSIDTSYMNMMPINNIYGQYGSSALKITPISNSVRVL